MNLSHRHLGTVREQPGELLQRHPQLEVDLSGVPNVMAHFKHMQARPSVKKLLAYEKDANEGFAKTAEASCADTRSRHRVRLFYHPLTLPSSPLQVAQ